MESLSVYSHADLRYRIFYASPTITLRSILNDSHAPTIIEKTDTKLQSTFHGKLDVIVVQLSSCQAKKSEVKEEKRVSGKVYDVFRCIKIYSRLSVMYTLIFHSGYCGLFQFTFLALKIEAVSSFLL